MRAYWGYETDRARQTGARGRTTRRTLAHDGGVQRRLQCACGRGVCAPHGEQNRIAKAGVLSLKKRSGKEKRFATDVNHGLSKAIVQTAKGTGRGTALEDLKNIRSRVNGSKRRQRVLHSWAFFQLRAFIAYKAALAGVRVVYVNPAYTSQTCSRCGHCEKANRKSHASFLCVVCGYSAHADLNAAVNIRARSRVAVIPPDTVPLAG